MRHYDHVGASVYLGAVFIPSSVTLMDVRAGTATIAKNAKSKAVSELQGILNKLKFTDFEGKALKLDDLFGPRTEAALKKAQDAIRARSPSAIMLMGVLDKPTMLGLDAMQAPLPSGEVIGPKPSASAPAPSAWWKSPWVLGAGVLLLGVAVKMVSGDDENKEA